jgi:hypothetical protein
LPQDQTSHEMPPEEQLHEFVMRSGATTRTVTLRTGEKVSFAREALDDAVRQIESGFIPMTTEHLSYLPPFGRIHRAEVVEDRSGHADLIFHGRELRRRWSRDLALGDMTTDGEPGDGAIDFELSAEPRNFEAEVWQELQETAPVQLQGHIAWADLPPVIWILTTVVTLGVGEFAKGFVAKFGENLADRLPSWLVSAAKKAKNSGRHNLLQFRFETTLGVQVTAFVPFDPHAADAVEKLRDGLNRLGTVGDFAGFVSGGGVEDMQMAAFIFDEGEFHLAWWASPDTAYISPWFERHHPDPTLFLGRPLLAPRAEDNQKPPELPVPDSTA